MLKRYIAQGTVIHDQATSKAGDKIMLEEAQAKPLEDLGYVKFDETQPEETPAQSTDTPQTNPATSLDPASAHNMTSQQTGEPMTAAPSGAQVGPDQPLPPATTTPETQPAADQPGASESVLAAAPANNPTPEQINQDMEQLG